MEDLLHEARNADVCAWKLDVEAWTSIWDTSCGEAFLVLEGGPTESGMRWCCYCGKALEEVPGGRVMRDEEG